MMSETVIAKSFLPFLRFDFSLQCLRHFLRRTFALLFLAPMPRVEEGVGPCRPILHCLRVDELHEAVVEHHSQGVGIILDRDLSRNFFPFENLVSGHALHLLIYGCAVSFRNRSTAAEAFAPYPSAPISSANIWLIGAPPIANLVSVLPDAWNPSITVFIYIMVVVSNALMPMMFGLNFSAAA